MSSSVQYHDSINDFLTSDRETLNVCILTLFTICAELLLVPTQQKYLSLHMTAPLANFPFIVFVSFVALPIPQMAESTACKSRAVNAHTHTNTLNAH